MVNFEKHIAASIDGKDFETLVNVATAARVYLETNSGGKSIYNMAKDPVGQFTREQAREMMTLIDRIFEA